jgi:BirA family biotin operon repressor/biotin-[acetyl-CoA-carboxylase] ligase
VTPPGLFAARTEFLGVVQSTMEEARARAQRGAPHGTTVVAQAQWAGRGRHGRGWVSAPGAGLFLTTLLRPPATADVRGLSLCAGAAVLAAVHALGATQARIKWPNDIWVHEHKLAGVLTELVLPPPPPDGAPQPSQAAPAVLVGVGLNLAPKAPQALQTDAATPPYVGLRALCPSVTPQLAARQVADALEAAYGAWQRQGLGPTLRVFAQYHALANAQVRAQDLSGRAIVGQVLGVAADGGLVLSVGGHTTTLYAGEVTRVRPVKP